MTELRALERATARLLTALEEAAEALEAAGCTCTTHPGGRAHGRDCAGIRAGRPHRALVRRVRRTLAGSPGSRSSRLFAGGILSVRDRADRA